MAVWTVVILASMLGYFPGGSDDIPRAPVLPQSHKGIDCSRCHPLLADLNAPTSIPVIDAQCRECHTAQVLQRTSLLTFHEDLSRACSDCHFFHRPDSIYAAGREFQIAARRPQLESICASCHGLGQDLLALSPGHKAAARLFHSELVGSGGLSPSEACLLCHSERSRQNLDGYGEIPQFDGRHTHPTGVTMVTSAPNEGSRIKPIVDARVQLFEGKIECQTCHSLSAQTQFHLAGFSDRNELCRACHQFD